MRGLFFLHESALEYSTFRGAIVQGSRKTIDGVGIRNIWTASRFKGLAYDGLCITFEPLPEDERNFLVRLNKGVRGSALGKDDDGAIESGPKPRDVRVPKQGSSLAHYSVVVSIALPGLDWALCYVSRPIGPSTP